MVYEFYQISCFNKTYTFLNSLENKNIIDKLILSINFNRLVLVKTKEILLKMEIKIEIPQDIISDKKRLNSVQQGILKAISRGPYEEGLAFNIVKATFD
jgi:hypothetical protein